MRAAVLDHGKFAIREQAVPEPRPGYVVLRVRACGVCRTDLHIVDGELPARREAVIPGHQIVGEVAGTGARVGVSWIGGTDGTCPYCRRGMENLCDAPTFTGYTVDGGYADYALAREDFVFPLPEALDDLHAAPLLCAGIIGFRSLRVAGVEPGERVGLFGFGASAHLAIAVLRSWGCEVYVSTSGAVVVTALGSLRKGGVVAINAIHLDGIPEFDYDSLLWGERQIRSVANMTRADARDFLLLAADIKLHPRVT